MMTDEDKKKWLMLLSSSDPVAAMHARNRLEIERRLQEGLPPQEETPQTKISEQVLNAKRRITTISRRWVDRISTCLYRDCHSGCQLSTCFWGKRGYKPQGSSFTHTSVNIIDCMSCFEEMDRKQ